MPLWQDMQPLSWALATDAVMAARPPARASASAMVPVRFIAFSSDRAVAH
jgi:hypothetical protein